MNTSHEITTQGPFSLLAPVLRPNTITICGYINIVCDQCRVRVCCVNVKVEATSLDMFTLNTTLYKVYWGSQNQIKVAPIGLSIWGFRFVPDSMGSFHP